MNTNLFYAFWIISTFYFIIEPTPLMASTESNPIMVIGYEEKENSPYYLETKNELTNRPGVTPEVLRLVADRIKIKIQFVRLPWSRALKSLELNKIDGLFHASFLKARMKLGVYPMKNGLPDPERMIMKQQYYLYIHHDEKHLWQGKHSLNSIPGPIAALVNYAIVKDLNKQNIAVVEMSNHLAILKMLEKKRVKGFANIDTMTDPVINKHPSLRTSIIKLEPSLKTRPYYLMISHKFAQNFPEITQSIWKELKHIRESGDYEKIFKSYQ